MDNDEVELLAGFAARMNEICDDMQITAGHGRQTALAANFKVTAKAARKWLLGLGYPEMSMAVRLANWAGVNLTWLLQGAGSKHGDKVDFKAIVIAEAIKSLPREMGLDLMDNLRAKLERVGKIRPEESGNRYVTMLDGYEQEIGRKPS
jgi:hypothetical protein